METEITGEQFSEGIAATAILSLIYLLTQGVGFLNSLKHSFVGSGRMAYDRTRGESSYGAFKNKYIMPMFTTAQKRLEYLRTRLCENVDYGKHPATMSCYEYYQKQQLENESPSAPQSTAASVDAASVDAASVDAASVDAASVDAAPVDAASMESLMHEARKIFDEKDEKMRSKLLKYAADGSEQRRNKLNEAIKYLKGEEQARLSEEEQRREARTKLEKKLLGGDLYLTRWVNYTSQVSGSRVLLCCF